MGVSMSEKDVSEGHCPIATKRDWGGMNGKLIVILFSLGMHTMAEETTPKSNDKLEMSYRKQLTVRRLD